MYMYMYAGVYVVHVQCWTQAHSFPFTTPSHSASYSRHYTHRLPIPRLSLRLYQFVEGDIGCPDRAVSFIRCYGEVYDVASQHGVVPDLIFVCVGEIGDPGEGGGGGDIMPLHVHENTCV